MKQILYTLLTISISFSIILAQNSQAINLKEINVEGNTLTSSEVIVFTSGLKAGNIIKSGDFSRAIKQLWKSGLFNNIQIYISDETVDGISAVISVDEAPVLGEIIISGDKKVSKSKIEEAIGLRSGQRIPQFQIESGKSKVIDLYSEEGFLLANIEVSLEELKEDTTVANPNRYQNTRNLKYTISEGGRIKTDKIEFIGNENYTDRRLRRALKETKQQRWYLFWRSSFDNNKFQDDKEKLKAFYQKHGYRDAMIVADSIAYGEDKKNMNLWLTLNEGPKYYYRNFSWEGNELYTAEELNRALGIEKGEAYNEEDLQKGIYERAQSLYMDKGYIYSNLIPNIAPVGNDSL